MKRDIKRIVSHYRKKFNTTDPYVIPHQLGILYQTGALKYEGCYMFLKNHRYIFLNEDLSPHEQKLVMAHELGHAILHRKENCYFIRNKTLLLNSKNEIEANKFAIELLLPDEILNDYIESGYTIEQVARITGYYQKLIELRLKV